MVEWDQDSKSKDRIKKFLIKNFKYKWESKPQ